MIAFDDKRVLSVAGIDPCGGAGLTADARSLQAIGMRAATVPTCWTEQDRHGFRAAGAIAPEALRAMLDAVRRDGEVSAVKTGLFVDLASIEVFADWFGEFEHRPPLVVDPVLSATAGGGFDRVREIAAMLIARLGPLGAVWTPNSDECEKLGATDPRALLERGARGVLVTGGDSCGDEVVDRLWTDGATHEMRHPRFDVGPVHGTGCALSTCLAVELARGRDLRAACRRAVERVAVWIGATEPGADGLPVPLAIGH